MDLHDVETYGEEQEQEHQLVLRERGRRIKAAAELGLARSSASRGRQRGRSARALVVVPPEEDTSAATGKRRAPKEATATPLQGRGDHEDEEEGEDEVVLVEDKVALLRQLVPGGEGMAVEGLLEETADYIAALKAQVGVMRALTCLLSTGSDDLDAALRPESLSADGVVHAPEKPM